MNTTSDIAISDLNVLKSSNLVTVKDVSFAVVFRGDTQFVFDLNHGAEVLLRTARQCEDVARIPQACAIALDVPENVARDFIEFLVEDWTNFGAVGAPLEEQMPDVGPDVCPPPNDARADYSETVHLGGTPVDVKIYDAELCSILTPMFDGGGTLPLTETNYSIASWRQDDFWISHDSQGQTLSYYNVQDARDSVLTQMIKASREHLTEPPAIHGATLRTESGKNIMLSGDSGRGKTTLSLGLAKHGFRILSDDLSIYNSTLNLVEPIALNPSVKQGSWGPLSALYPELLKQEPIDIKGRLCKYIQRSFIPADDGPHGLDALVFPNWQKDASAQLTPYNNRESILSMLRYSFLPNNQTELQSMADFLTAIPLYQLTYSDFEPASALLLDLLDD